jgi:HlyD family secretion protein
MPKQSDNIKIKFSSNGNRVRSNLLEKGLAVQELISNKPGFLIRWGVTIFLFILIAIITATWFIRYPDIVSTKARLASLNAPKEIVVKLDGQLIKLFTKEGDVVKKEQVIGYMESTANPETILFLSSKLDSLRRRLVNNQSNVTSFSFAFRERWDGSLGELQQPYQTFNQSFILFRSYLSSGFYLRKRSMLMKDMATLQRLDTNLNQQKNLQAEDINLAQQTFVANEQLKNDSVISDFDYRNESSKLLSKKMGLPQISSSIISNEGQQNEKKKEIMELENQISQQKNIFIQALNTFISQVDEWKKKYLLISPVDGKIAFADFMQEHQQLHSNQIICFVNPQNSQYYAELYFPQFNLGKIRTGQQVLLKFPSYPFQEYGNLTGKIEFISTIPTDSGYLAKVSLINGLNTNYDKPIQYREGLIAQGEIITHNMRLLERFYYNIVKEIKK